MKRKYKHGIYTKYKMNRNEATMLRREVFELVAVLILLVIIEWSLTIISDAITPFFYGI